MNAIYPGKNIWPCLGYLHKSLKWNIYGIYEKLKEY